MRLDPQPNEIGLIHVGTHEVGHAAGMDSYRREIALLNPTYSRRIYAPQRADIESCNACTARQKSFCSVP